MSRGIFLGFFFPPMNEDFEIEDTDPSPKIFLLVDEKNANFFCLVRTSAVHCTVTEEEEQQK